MKVSQTATLALFALSLAAVGLAIHTRVFGFIASSTVMSLIIGLMVVRDWKAMRAAKKP